MKVVQLNQREFTVDLGSLELNDNSGDQVMGRLVRLKAPVMCGSLYGDAAIHPEVRGKILVTLLDESVAEVIPMFEDSVRETELGDADQAAYEEAAAAASQPRVVTLIVVGGEGFDLIIHGGEVPEANL